jgi:hypothetical protein
MTRLTSALNYGALITLSCCNAVLQIAAAPSCNDPTADANWPSCAPDGSIAEADLRRQLFKPGTVTRMVMEKDTGGGHLVADFYGDGRLATAPPGGDNVGREWQIDGDRVCLRYDPGYRSQPECGAFEVHRGKLYLVQSAGLRKAVDSIEWTVQ